MIASAIVCQIQKITEHGLKHDRDRLVIRGALRNALLALQRERDTGKLTWYDRYLIGDMPDAAEREKSGGGAA